MYLLKTTGPSLLIFLLDMALWLGCHISETSGYKHSKHQKGHGFRSHVKMLKQPKHVFHISDFELGDLEMYSDDPDATSVDNNSDSWSDYLNTLFDPVFDPESSPNVSAVIGQTAHLPCRVNNLGTKTVSWIRHRDTHILTVGSFPYTGDKRFSALHREGTNEWTLQIIDPTTKDSGLYECQVSTKPVRAYLVRLDVLVPTAKILHAPELHTDEGGVLNLTCIVAPSPSPPEYIFWYHKGKVINYETDKRVQVSLRQENQRTVSSLVVSPASMNHSGKYTCEPSNTNSATITVHLFKAEEPAAMQTSSGRPLIQFSLMFLFYPLVIIFSYSIQMHRHFIYFYVALTILCLSIVSMSSYLNNIVNNVT